MRRMRHLKPREVQGCDIAFQFWRPETLYDATIGGNLVAASGAIARAEDVSGNGNHATQSDGTAQPTRQVAAQKGLDAARFDGSNDVLNAGDVADMLDKPVEIYVVYTQTTTGAGIFGKSRAANTTGRFTIANNGAKDSFLFSGSYDSGVQPSISASSSAVKILYGHHQRGNGTVTVARNVSTVVTEAVTETGASQNTADSVLIGAYQTSGGAASLAGTFLTGDVVECAKFSRSLGAHARLRVQHAAMRRARIAG